MRAEDRTRIIAARERIKRLYFYLVNIQYLVLPPRQRGNVNRLMNNKQIYVYEKIF